MFRIRLAPAKRCYGAGGGDGNFVAYINRWSAAMPQPNDLSRSLVALDQDSTIIAVVEMSQSSWLVGGVLPGIEHQPRKKLEPSPERLLALLHRWRDESVRAGRTITRIAVAFEAGRDGFWLARWLGGRGAGGARVHAPGGAAARVPGVAAWRTARVQHGARSNDRRRGRQAAQSGARVPGQGTHAACQPHEGHAGPARHSQFQTNPAPGGPKSGNHAHPGGHAGAAKCLGRAATRCGAAGVRCRPDQANREGSSTAIRRTA